VRRWDDAAIRRLNPHLNLPAEAIAVVARRDGSGTTYAFTNHLSAISEIWRDQGPGTEKLINWPSPTMLASGNDGVARLIRRTPGTIGYVEFGTASRARLAMARLENRAGEFVAPTGPSGMATLANATLPDNQRAFFPDPEGGDSYPIVTYTWLLLHEQYETPGKAETIKDFVRWCLTDGQQCNERLGFIKLPPNVADSALEAVAAVSSPSSGSQFRANASR
jgi:phosphate transport system substrate-binding protein